jgi:WD40 repeat protein
MLPNSHVRVTCSGCPVPLLVLGIMVYLSPAAFAQLPPKPGDKIELDPAHIQQIKELKYPSPLISCRFDPTGRFVFAGAQDRTVQRWELSSDQRTTLTGHKSWVRGLAFLQDGKTLIAGDYAGQVRFWAADVLEPTAVRTIQAHLGWIRAVAVSPDDKYLATCGDDNLVKLWTIADGKLLRQLNGHTSHVYNVAFHPMVKRLVSADLRGVVKEWDLATGKLIRDLDVGVLPKYDRNFEAHIGGVRAMAYSSDGKLLACTGITDVQNALTGLGKPMVVLFDAATGKRKQLLVPKENFQGTAGGVVIHPEGFLVGVGGSNGGAMWFWKPDQPQAFFTLKLPNNARDLDMHPDGRRLAVAFADGAVRIYEMPLKAQP